MSAIARRRRSTGTRDSSGWDGVRGGAPRQRIRAEGAPIPSGATRRQASDQLEERSAAAISYRGVMKEEVLGTSRAHERELPHRGMPHAALFSSTARGDDTPDRDINILI